MCNNEKVIEHLDCMRDYDMNELINEPILSFGLGDITSMLARTYNRVHSAIINNRTNLSYEENIAIQDTNESTILPTSRIDIESSEENIAIQDTNESTILPTSSDYVASRETGERVLSASVVDMCSNSSNQVVEFTSQISIPDSTYRVISRTSNFTVMVEVHNQQSDISNESSTNTAIKYEQDSISIDKEKVLYWR